MSKNIVICCDGTDNSYGPENTNVVKLFAMLDRTPEQVLFYDPGLGTFGAPGSWSRVKRWWTQFLGRAFGLGFEDNLFEAYRFLMEHYQEGDRIYLFGFSRGAFIVRTLAALVHMCGLLHKDSANLVPYAFRLLEKEDFLTATGFKATFARPVPIHFLGVWDTVKSLRNANPFQEDSYPYTAKNPDVAYVRHAVAIDERRCYFRQNRWSPSPGQDVKEVWFAGVHSDVGGGYPEPESALSKLALQWMVREAEDAHLSIDPARKAATLPAADTATATAPACTGMPHNSLTWIWWPLEFIPKSRRQAPTANPSGGESTWRKHWRIYGGRRRTMAPPITLHQSVLDRMAALPGYRPKNLPPTAQCRIEH